MEIDGKRLNDTVNFVEQLISSVKKPSPVGLSLALLTSTGLTFEKNNDSCYKWHMKKVKQLVPVTIMLDSGAVDSTIQASALPFSNDSDTGNSAPVLGMGLNVLQVPLHNIVLHSDLFEGQIEDGVRCVLPVKEITLIFGNTVAGGRVWVDVLQSFGVTPT